MDGRRRKDWMFNGQKIVTRATCTCTRTCTVEGEEKSMEVGKIKREELGKRKYEKEGEREEKKCGLNRKEFAE